MAELPIDITFEDWVCYIFSQDVHAEPTWELDVDEDSWNEDRNPLLALEHMTRLFAGPGFLMDEYTAVQIDRGLNFLFSNSFSNYMYLIREKKLPLEKRAACIEAIESLYADLMAPVYGDLLAHLDEEPEDPETPRFSCYMWWDISPINPSGEGEDITTKLLLKVFEKVLRLKSEACLESVLHGLGHWTLTIPEQTTPLINRFLKRTDISPALRAYARQAATGMIQ